MSAPLPPGDLHAREPRVVKLKVGDRLYRFFEATYEPVHFDRTTLGRLNAPDGGYGVLYAATDLRGAFAETFLRTPGRRMVDPSLLARKALVTLEVLRPLPLIHFDGPGLPILGATAEVVHGSAPYDVPQSWSAALKSHPMAAGGIAYSARHDPHELCLALFEGAPVREIERDEELDAAWFWELAEIYRLGRAP